MTRQEKLSLLWIPVLALLLAIKSLNGSGPIFRTGPDLYPAFWFPVLFYILCFWANRAVTGSWIEFPAENTIRSRRPMALRILAGLFAAVFVVPVVWLCEDISWPLTVLQFLGLFFTLLTLGGIVVLFLFFAGPQEMRFDLHRGEWQRTRGFPLLSWTSHGLTYEGT
jgi:hypothetical protein